MWEEGREKHRINFIIIRLVLKSLEPEVTHCEFHLTTKAPRTIVIYTTIVERSPSYLHMLSVGTTFFQVSFYYSGKNIKWYGRKQNWACRECKIDLTAVERFHMIKISRRAPFFSESILGIQNSHIPSLTFRHSLPKTQIDVVFSNQLISLIGSLV